MILTQIITSFSGFISNIMLAHLGHDVLAASALLSSTQIMITLTFISIFFSLGVMIARAKGRGDTTEVGNLMQQSWILALILSLGALLIYWFIYPILMLFGQDPYLASLVVPYFHWAMLGMPILMLNVTCSQLCFATGKQVLITGVMGIQATVLVLSADIFIFGKLGMPAMGIAGFGVAFDIATLTQFILVTLALLKFDEFQHYHLFRVHMRDGWAHLKQLFAIGWPISIQMTGELMSFSFITYMVGWLGAVPLAASQITTQFMFLLIIPAFGFGSAAAILVGRSAGTKDYVAVKAAGYLNLLMSLTVVVVLGSLLIGFDTMLAHWFITPGQKNYTSTINLVKPLFIFGVIALMFDTVRNTLTGALRGLIDTRVPMYVGLLSLWVIRIPLAYLFGFIWHGGVIGIAWSSMLAMMVGGLLIYWRWRYKLADLRPMA
jgi:MATE family multidrug resistance protein